jgi:hypothetical protein
MSEPVLESLEKLRNYVEKAEFKGFDPYDALNSRILRMLSLGRKSGRILLTQAMKRLPVNLRPLLGIRRGLNPKGLGLFLWGYAKLYALEKRPEFLERQNEIIELLEESRSPGYAAGCWGYNFDWQSRAFFLPKHTPTIVNTSFIGHALLDAYRLSGNERALDMALSTADFILNDLNRKTDGSSLCFSYSPLDQAYVHNANLLGGSLLIRLYQHTGESAMKEAATASLDYTMGCQRADGSWPYAETDYQSWIDSFHTGFNLQSILYFLQAGFGDPYREAFERGVRFYEERFFLDDGTPKYYADRLFPVDVHAAAQAVVVFSRLGGNRARLARKLAGWMIDHLQDPRGYFYFQRHRRWTNRIVYMRWAQAWAFHALTDYLYDCRGGYS